LKTKKSTAPKKVNTEKSIKRRDFVKGAAAVGAVASLQGCATLVEPKAKREPDTVETEYDFIVVGTGAGGAPLASRLALQGFSVLCIEAGFENKEASGEDPMKMQVPVYHGISSEAPEWSWNFFVRHNAGSKRNVLGQKSPDLRDTKFEAGKGGILYPRASTIGGCTTQVTRAHAFLF